MPRTLRVLNVGTAVATLLSAIAVAVSDVVDPAYRAHYGDALWFVVVYAAFYGTVAWAFVRRSAAAPWLAVAKAAGAYLFLVACVVAPWAQVPEDGLTKGLGAYLFLALFTDASRAWMALTPGRYVYQLFDWGPEAAVVFFAFVFLGRGVWNTVNAFALTRERWMRLRARSPLVGRLLTALPVSITVVCVWAFLAVARIQTTTFSPEAREVAETVFAGLDCDAVRTKSGTTTTDVRQRGDRRYEVLVSYGCRTTGVLVRTQDDKIGSIAGPREECCPQ
jgi:hypothetical protein